MLIPSRLGARRSGESLEIVVTKPAKACRVAVRDAQGQTLVARPVEADPVRLSLSDLPARSATPACVKLLDGGRLLDAAPILSDSR